MDADVAVIGLGTMGSMTIWQLARRGISVLGFEQFGIGHDRSAYGGGSRRFRIASPFVEEIPFLKESYRKFRELEQESGQELLSYSGALTIGDPHSEHQKNVMTGIEEHNLNDLIEVLEEKDAAKRYPQHRLLPGEVIIKDNSGGVLRSEQIVISAVNRAKVLGAKVFSYSPIDDIQADSEGVTIKASNSEYRVGKVVITTGAWANKLVPSLNKVFTARRIIMSWFMPQNPNQFIESKFPNFTRLSDGIHIQGTPALDGRMVRVSNNSPTIPEAKVEVKDPDFFDKNVSVEYAKSVRENVTSLIPNLNPDPIRINPFVEGFTEDKLPIVGRTKENENVILVCGFSGQGFSQSPAMGEIASDLVINNKTNYHISHLSPNRFGL